MYNPAASEYRNTSGTITPAAVTTKPCNVVGWNLYNPGSSDCFVKFYDETTANTTVGTTTPKRVIYVPALSQVVEPRNGNTPQNTFSTAFTVAVTLGHADNNAVAPTTPIILSIQTL